MTETNTFRAKLQSYCVENALPRHKYGHQPRLYRLTRQIGEGLLPAGLTPARPTYDDDVVFAATWLHDLGVFIGHRPEAPEALRQWDHVAYVVAKAPVLLRSMDFPEEKIDAVLEVMRTHQPRDNPQTLEGEIVRDADILEQLGAIGILRTASKVGSDTRFTLLGDVQQSLANALKHLPSQIRLEPTRILAQPRIELLRHFLEALDAESEGQLD